MTDGGMSLSEESYARCRHRALGIHPLRDPMDVVPGLKGCAGNEAGVVLGLFPDVEELQ